MSKQPARKNNTGLRSTQAQGSTSSTTSTRTTIAPAGKGSGATSSTRTAANSARRGATTPQKKTSFKLRPLDIALTLGLLLVIAAIIWSGLNPSTVANPNVAGVPEAASNTPATTGNPAPDFTLPATDNTPHTLSAQKGKVVLLEFMAPWCPHCQNDAPEFNKLHDAYKDKGVQIYAVSATSWGKDYQPPDVKPPITMQDMIWFRDTFNVQYPMLFDPDLKAANAYTIEYYPTVFIIDKAGNIFGKYLAEQDSPLTAEKLGPELDKALQQ